VFFIGKTFRGFIGGKGVQGGKNPRILPADRICESRLSSGSAIVTTARDLRAREVVLGVREQIDL
jgi:hypothetical protein